MASPSRGPLRIASFFAVAGTNEQPNDQPMTNPVNERAVHRTAHQQRAPPRWRRRTRRITTSSIVEGGVPALLHRVLHVTKRFVVGREEETGHQQDQRREPAPSTSRSGMWAANGSGKSTLIRLVSTLLTLDAGRVEVFGRDIKREEMSHRHRDQPGERGRGLPSESIAAREPLTYARSTGWEHPSQAKHDAMAPRLASRHGSTRHSE